MNVRDNYAFCLNLSVALAIEIIFVAPHVKGSDFVSDKKILRVGDELTIPIEPNTNGYDLEARIAIKGNRNVNGLGKAKWGLSWVDADGKEVASLEIRWGNESLGDYLDRRYMEVKIDSISKDGTHYNKVVNTFYDGVDLYGGYNYLLVDGSRHGINAWIGEDKVYAIGDCKMPLDAASIDIKGNKTLDVSYAVCRFMPDKSRLLQTDWDAADVLEYTSNCQTGLEGIWTFLDRDMDVRWANIGGVYRLGVVRHSSLQHVVEAPLKNGKMPVFDILYLGGGRVNGNEWTPGMVKGYLYPTIFENHYDLVWYDAYMDDMGDEVTADIIDGAILSLNFPLHHSQMRFSKDM